MRTTALVPAEGLLALDENEITLNEKGLTHGHQSSAGTQVRDIIKINGTSCWNQGYGSKLTSLTRLKKLLLSFIKDKPHEAELFTLAISLVLNELFVDMKTGWNIVSSRWGLHAIELVGPWVGTLYRSSASWSLLPYFLCNGRKWSRMIYLCLWKCLCSKLQNSSIRNHLRTLFISMSTGQAPSRTLYHVLLT